MIATTFVFLGPLAAVALLLAPRRGAAALALAGAGTGLVAAVVTLLRVADGARDAATLPGLPGQPLRLVADPLAGVLVTTVATVTLLVLVYATGYLDAGDDHVRFFAGMSFFAAAMQLLVLAGDWLLLLAAWELIGLASYLLIGFWFTRPGVAPAATRAFLTTRAADLGLYLGIFVLVTQTGTTAIAPTLALRGSAAAVAGALLLVSAMGKAAQAPFQGWLQDAMAGPTPVSALLHSATLVAAGAYLLTRAYPLLPPTVLLAVGLVGGVTAVVTGVMALAQRDLKRLLAASTSSQLGFMLLALGAGSPGAAVAHLVAQAAMKSALFLGAGIFQHARESTAFAELGGVGRTHRRAFAGFTLAGLALAGVPPLAGFWTKDAIVAAAWESSRAGLLAPLALAGALLTGGYVARALRLLWRGAGRDRPVRGLVPLGAGLAGLATLAATLGLAVRPLARLLGVTIPEAGFGPPLVLGLFAAGVGLAGGWLLPAERTLGPLRGWAEAGFQVGGGFNGLVVRPALALARQADRLDSAIHQGVLTIGRVGLRLARSVDRADRAIHRGVLAVGATGLALARLTRVTDERGLDGAIAALVAGVRALADRARRLQTGLVHRELLLAAGGVAALLLIVVLAGR